MWDYFAANVAMQADEGLTQANRVKLNNVKYENSEMKVVLTWHFSGPQHYGT